MKIRTPSLKRSLLSLIAVTVLVGISSPANGVLFATASAASTPALGSPTSASSHTTGSTSIDPRVAAALKWSAPDQVDTSLPFTDSLTYTPYSYPVGTSTVAQPCWPTNVSSGSCTSRNAIACPTTTLCLVANGQNILASTDPSGKASSWFVLHNALGTADPVETGTTYTLDSSDTITSIACNPSTPILCVAVDTSGDAFVDESVTNGAWAISPTGPWTTETSSQTVGTFDGIACPCNVPIDTIKQQSGTLSYGTPVNCTAASPCWIPNALTSVSCPTASTCVATDQSGYILDTIGLQNNGSSPTMPAWTVESISQTTGFFLGASCAAAAPCLLPVDDIVQTTGTSYGLSCAALTPCYLPTSINAIACPQITQCLIVDSQGNLFISSNPTSSASWGASIPVDRPTFVPVPIVAIACPSSSLCIAGDVNGNLLTSVSPQTASASSWVLTSQDSGNSIQAIYCPSITACYVADNKGNVLHGTSSFAISTTSLPGTTAGSSYSFQLSAVNGVTPYTWSITSGSLPPGLVFSTSGVISGVPSTAGTYLVGIQATDSSTVKQVATQQLAISIGSAGVTPLSITSLSLPQATLGEPYTTDLIAQGGTPPYTWAKTSGTLPSGITSISPAGVITGTPSSTGTYSFNVEVADSSSPAQSLTTSLNLTVSTVFTWSAPIAADGSSNNSIGDIACPSTSLCDIFDSKGQVAYSTNPTGPASAWLLAANGFNSISCPSSNLCAAVDTSGNLLFSTSMGTVTPSWNSELADQFGTSPPTPAYISSVSCDPNALQCSLADASDRSMTATPLANPPWSKPITLSAATLVGSSPLNGISCPSSVFCVAVDSIGNIFSLSWSSPGTGLTTPIPVKSDGTTISLTGISCPSLNLCVAIDANGGIVVSTNPTQGSNAVWTYSANVDGNRDMTSISCTSTGFCATVDIQGNVLTSSDPAGGRSSWTLTSHVDSTWFNSISCPIASFCLAVDGNGDDVVSNNPAGGATAWSAPATVETGQSIAAVSCPTTALCVAVDSNGDVVTGSSSSVAISLPLCDLGIFPNSATEGTPYPTPATCSTPPPVSPTTQLTVDGGVPPYYWSISAGSLPPGICLYPTSATTGACPSTVSSATVQLSGTPTSIGSFAFTVQASDSSTPPQSVTASYSITSAPQVNGFTWTTPAASNVDGVHAISSIACSSTTSCVAGDNIGNVWNTTNPTGPPASWLNPVPDTDNSAVPATNDIFGMSCAPPVLSTVLCAAVDDKGNLLTSIAPNAGTPVWQFAPPPSGQPANTPFDSGNEVTAVSCPSSSLCVAVDNKGNAISSTNPASPPPTIPTWVSTNAEGGGSSQFNAISCPTANFCAAVDDAGDVATSTNPSGGSSAWTLTHFDSFSGSQTYKGPGPSPASLTIHGFTSIWCTSLVFCVAADTTGHIATSTHPTAGASSWSISAVDPSTVAITAVDCPSNTFCMALDSSGAYLDSFDPTGGTTAWNTPTSSTPTSVIDAANILNSLSCPSTYLCLATDQAGDILVANANLPLSILTTSLPSVNEGNPYSQSLSAIGGNAPYAWSIASGSLPTGLTLTSAGTISGSPVTSGIATFVIRVADSSVPSQSAIKQLTIDVNSTQLAVTTTSLPSGNLDTSYSAVLGESGGSAPYTWSIGGGLLPTGLLLSSTGSIFGTPTISGSFSFAVTVTDSSVPPLTASAALVVTISSTPNPTSTQGYWLGGNVANSNGSVFAYGSLTTYPGTATLTPGESVVGIAGGPQSQGYWLATSTGGVFSFGSALFYGSMGGTPLFQPVVGMTSTPDGLGYWLVAADGGIFAFGDAVYYGSTGGRSLVQPIVGMASTPDGHGYWLVAADGGIFAFGDAGFYGSAGGISLAKPVSAMASTPDGHGYWLVGQDGGIFPYGDAGFFGSGASLSRPIAYPVVGILGTPDGLGYWMVSSDGGVFAFGDATFNGSKGVGSALIIGIAN